MIIKINDTDIAEKLAQFEGEHVVVEISCNDRKKYFMIGGTTEVIHETEYPKECYGGTDMLLGRVE